METIFSASLNGLVTRDMLESHQLVVAHRVVSLSAKSSLRSAECHCSELRCQGSRSIVSGADPGKETGTTLGAEFGTMEMVSWNVL